MQQLAWFYEAVAAGARRDKAADVLDISERTLRRWCSEDGLVQEDGRPQAQRPAPGNKLSEAEEIAILCLCNLEEYASLPPSQIVPRLADSGLYLASEATFYRVLKKHGQLARRGKAAHPKPRPGPTSHTATGPNQIWSWDISYLPSRVRGRFWYLYLVLDVYSRKIVAWEVHNVESGELASKLIERAVIKEKCLKKPLVLHSDNGAPMTSSTLQAKLADLGIVPSHSRPRVSNDNAFSESLFRTVKYCPQWPSQGFLELSDARRWMLQFERFYNEEHRHSAIKFVTPAQRHRGEDKEILKKRRAVYEQAKRQRPERWSRGIKDLTPVGAVSLNPEREEQKVKMAA
jgi:putative transposase